MPDEPHILTQALLDGDVLALAGAMLLAALAALIALRALWRLKHGGAGRSLFELLREERGTATMEFALVFPVAMFFSLLLAQITLLMVGNLFVHYAAFAATRAAITVIPEAYTSELRNEYVQGEGSAKHDLLRSAAAFALVPVAGRSETGTTFADLFEQSVSAHFEAYGQPTPRWVTSLAADRLRYASRYTTIRVYWYDGLIDDVPIFEPLADGEAHLFGPKDAVMVRVTHQLNLSIPYVRLFFADGTHTETNTGYTQIDAHYVLTNEGIDPALPATPTLPRNP